MSMMKRHLRRYLDAYMHLSVQLHLTPSFQTPNHSRDGDLSYNRLTGKIPFNIGFLQVVTLSLQGNQLSEQIPSVIGLMQALAVLDLSCNMLTGPIPPILGNFTYMEKLYLHGNKLTGQIPPELGNMSKLHYLPCEEKEV
ncbi:LRR receptor-like serine/threonine-protein kinase ERECTA isoform X2 [Eucalyptus grandis]|uniref:LRR receptor-like serine/threonine-protein kinase ERECTA isoform X2 n=1 Tax=Eucalyptus grandis TaxID=71139 RepID=UPI0008A0B245|nr:LRR receptor-like serine/threonine-protein kinase ERECTA isoform X2 [Eucalyptus grandis]